MLSIAPPSAVNSPLMQTCAPASERFALVRSVIQAEQQREIQSGVLPEYRTIALLHDGPTPRVGLLGHGLNQPTSEVALVAQSMFAQGMNVIAPRAPLHGFGAEGPHIRSLSSNRLHVFGRDWVEVAAGLGQSLYTAGISIGGTVALRQCLEHPSTVHSVVAMPSFGMHGIWDCFRKLILTGITWLPDRTHLPLVNIRAPGGSTRALAAAARFTIDTTDRMVLAERSVAPRCTFIIDPMDEMMRMDSLHTVAAKLRSIGVQVDTIEIDYMSATYHDKVGVPGFDPVARQLLNQDIERAFCLS